MKPKRIVKRSPGGKFYTVLEPQSDPREVDAAPPEQVWTMKGGELILIKDMGTSHIVAAIALLERRAVQALGAVRLPTDAQSVEVFCRANSPQYKEMKEEIKRRLKPEVKPLRVNRRINLNE